MHANTMEWRSVRRVHNSNSPIENVKYPVFTIFRLANRSASYNFPPLPLGQNLFLTQRIMLTLRLNRQGTKDRPFYKIVAVDSRKRRDGRYIEQIGSYNPMEEGVNYKIDVEKASGWISKGAQPSDTVRDILKKARKEALHAEA